jgi:hypothetical protein
MTGKQMIKLSNVSGKWLHASSEKLARESAEILIKIGVFFVRAIFVVAAVSVLITRAAFSEETIFSGKPEAVRLCATAPLRVPS